MTVRLAVALKLPLVVVAVIATGVLAGLLCATANPAVGVYFPVAGVAPTGAVSTRELAVVNVLGGATAHVTVLTVGANSNE